MQVELLEGDEEGVALCTQTVKTLRVDGYEIPHVRVLDYPDQIGMVSIILDDRLAYDFPRAELPTIAKLLADAMAIAAGRTSFGENSNISNPYGRSLAGYPTQDIVGEGFEH